MNIKEKIRDVFRFLQQKELGRNKYGNNGYVILSGKKYFVGKMSYDEWYLEPYRRNRTERDDFDKNTLWEKFDTIDIIQLFKDNNLLDIKTLDSQ